MAKLWGEGSENLTELLEYCIIHDIHTYASCRGHGDFPHAYIGFRDMPKDFYAYLTNFIIQNTSITDTYCLQLDKCDIYSLIPRFNVEISGSRKNIEEMFAKILRGIEEYTKGINKNDIPHYISDKIENYFKNGNRNNNLILRNRMFINKENYLTTMDVIKERFSSSVIGKATINVSTRLKDRCAKRMREDMKKNQEQNVDR